MTRQNLGFALLAILAPAYLWLAYHWVTHRNELFGVPYPNELISVAAVGYFSFLAAILLRDPAGARRPARAQKPTPLGIVLVTLLLLSTLVLESARLARPAGDIRVFEWALGVMVGLSLIALLVGLLGRRSRR